MRACTCGNTQISDEMAYWESDGCCWRFFCNECSATTAWSPSCAGSVDDWNNQYLTFEGERSLFKEIVEGFDALKEERE